MHRQLYLNHFRHNNNNNNNNNEEINGNIRNKNILIKRRFSYYPSMNEKEYSHGDVMKWKLYSDIWRIEDSEFQQIMQSKIDVADENDDGCNNDASSNIVTEIIMEENKSNYF